MRRDMKLQKDKVKMSNGEKVLNFNELKNRKDLMADIKELKLEMEKYLKNVTEEQLIKDLKNVGIELIKKEN